MSWGVEGPFPIPDGSTWDGVTGRELESSGSSMNWYGFNYQFHVYVEPYPWTTISWIELTGGNRPVQSFNLRRGVSAWWKGTRAGGGTIVLDNGDGGGIEDSYGVSTRIRLSVDTPSGEHDLFTGFIQSRTQDFDAAGYAILRLQVIDHIGYTGQATYPTRTAGNQTTAWILSNMLTTSGAGIVSGDLNGILASGLTQNNSISSGNLINKINEYVRSELGMLWIDASGVWQFRAADWWYPQPDPVATIGSLDRGGGGLRDDPSLADSGWRFAASRTTTFAEMAYNWVTWTNSVWTSTTSANNTARTGIRKYTSTTEITTQAVAFQQVDFLAKVLLQSDAYDGPDFDSFKTIRFPADVDLNAMEYAARADMTDFIEGAWETQLRFRREWHPGWVMGVSHSYSPANGWWTELVVDGVLAQYNAEIG